MITALTENAAIIRILADSELSVIEYRFLLVKVFALRFVIQLSQRFMISKYCSSLQLSSSPLE